MANENGTIREALARVETSIEFIKNNQTKDLSAINEHLKLLNNNVSKNAGRSIENIASIKIHWKLIITILGIGGAIIAILLEVLLKVP